MVNLVHGVGINDRSRPAKIEGKLCKEYNLWTSMLNRVYSKTELLRRPNYIGCSVSDDFKYYHIFYEWCQSQIGFNLPNFTLDKDLIIRYNKLYSKDTCVFIPVAINSLLTKRTLDRGPFPIGVHKYREKFRSQCSTSNGRIHLGTFDTPELAFQAYKTFKEAYIKEQAELYKDSIDPRAYLALLNYEVSIDD